MLRDITFYCGGNVEDWGPSSLFRGVGGSEEAVIHVARQLAQLGIAVDVFGQPGPDEGLHEGVRWHDHRSFDPSVGGDVFVAWRDASFVAQGARWGQRYHWLHNHQEAPYPRDVLANVDRIIVVSREHARDSGLAAVDANQVHCTSNGLAPEFLRPPGANQPHRAIYASCPARGLLLMLELWPYIRRRVPDATLEIFYGFTPVYDEMARFFPGLSYIRYACEQLLDQPGVHFHGRVGQDRLADEFAAAGVWVYPTECEETSCITAMKALAMGCLPVTSGLGVLAETLGGRDLGPTHAVRPISRSRWRKWLFARAVVRAMRRGDSPAFARKRLEWSAWARERYSWRKTATEWRDLFTRVAAEKGGPAAAGGSARSRDSQPSLSLATSP